MSGIGSGYDYDVIYSPDGKIFQTEYAQKAVDNSQTAVGLRCKDGVLLAVEKPTTSKLLVDNSTRRIFSAAHHVGMASTGLAADGRQVVNRAMSECANYKTNYGIEIPGHLLGERLGAVMHMYTLYGGTRPFGTNALVATHDKKHGHALYLVETSGIVHRFFATAIGKHRQAAKTELEKLKLSEITCEEALPAVAKMFISQRDDQKPHELEMAWLTEGNGWVFAPVPVAKVKEAEDKAHAEIDDSDMDDD